MTSAPTEPVGDSGPELAVGAIWQIEDSLVLVRRGRGAADGDWGLPGGAVQYDETLAEAVVRCVADAGGVDALCGPFLGWGERVEPREHVVTMYFDAVVLDATTPIAPAHDAEEPAGGHEVRTVPLWEVPELRLAPGLAEFLTDQEIIELML